MKSSLTDQPLRDG